MNEDRNLYLRVVKSARGLRVKEDECHIYDEDGNRLGILPCSRIEGIVDYSDVPRLRIEIIANRIEMESLRPESQPSAPKHDPHDKSGR